MKRKFFDLSSPARRQLDAIASLAHMFRERRIDAWLFGGWAVDFWVGRVSRAHDDVDLAVLLGDRAAIHDLILGAGWLPAPVDDAAKDITDHNALSRVEPLGE